MSKKTKKKKVCRLPKDPVKALARIRATKAARMRRYRARLRARERDTHV